MGSLIGVISSSSCNIRFINVAVNNQTNSTISIVGLNSNPNVNISSILNVDCFSVFNYISSNFPSPIWGGNNLQSGKNYFYEKNLKETI